MRHAFTRAALIEQGTTPSAIRWKLRTKQWRQVLRAVYLDGRQPPTAMERALATVVATDGVASCTLAARLHDLDGVKLRSPFATIPTTQETRLTGVRRRNLDSVGVVTVNGYRCTNGLQTMLDLAAVVDDLVWEQALESVLRHHLTSIDEIEASLCRRRVGNERIRRVLAMRPQGAPATGSLLETLMVQLIRTQPSLPPPQRQVEVRSLNDTFIAFVDLAWPSHGVFLELDGQQHKGQPVYDSRRETAVVAAKGWLPGRFTWDEVNIVPKTTLRRVVELFEQATSLSQRSKVS